MNFVLPLGSDNVNIVNGCLKKCEKKDKMDNL